VTSPSREQEAAELDSPGAQVGVAVAVVSGVGAVVFDTAGTLPDARPRAPPVGMPLVGSSDPPGERDAIWGSKHGVSERRVQRVAGPHGSVANANTKSLHR